MKEVRVLDFLDLALIQLVGEQAAGIGCHQLLGLAGGAAIGDVGFVALLHQQHRRDIADDLHQLVQAQQHRGQRGDDHDSPADIAVDAVILRERGAGGGGAQKSTNYRGIFIEAPIPRRLQ